MIKFVNKLELEWCIRGFCANYFQWRSAQQKTCDEPTDPGALTRHRLDRKWFTVRTWIEKVV